MRWRRWLLLGNIGLGACLLVGCLRQTLPPDAREIRKDLSVQTSTPVTEEEKRSAPPSDYLVSRTSALQLDFPPTVTPGKSVESPAEKQSEKVEEKPVEPVEMRIKSETPLVPARPPEPPEPHMEVQHAPLTRPDSPSVQVLRGLLEHYPEDEIKDQLKSYDPTTRDAMLLLLASIAQLEQSGGISRMSPRDLATWSDRLNMFTASMRGHAQLILERMCFCSYIKNFGDFAPLPPEHTFFRPGEEAHVYVQVRNFSSRRERDQFVTVLKGRLEIYDENNRNSPPITWASKPRVDISASPRQDYYINFRFPVLPSCPPGLYTMRITVEDWTDAPPGAKTVPESRIAQRTLDFRVGGPIARRARNPVAVAAPSR